jgi:hypothetical protein
MVVRVADRKTRVPHQLLALAHHRHHSAVAHRQQVRPQS